MTGRCSVNWNYSPCLKARFVHLSASRFQASYIVGRLPCGAILSLPQRGRSHLLFLIMDDVVLQGICVGPGWAVAQRLNFCAQEPIMSVVLISVRNFAGRNYVLKRDGGLTNSGKR